MIREENQETCAKPCMFHVPYKLPPLAGWGAIRANARAELNLFVYSVYSVVKL